MEHFITTSLSSGIGVKVISKTAFVIDFYMSRVQRGVAEHLTFAHYYLRNLEAVAALFCTKGPVGLPVSVVESGLFSACGCVTLQRLPRLPRRGIAEHWRGLRNTLCFLAKEKYKKAILQRLV